MLLLFGIIWTFISLSILFILIYLGIKELIVYIFISIFVIVGIIMLVVEIKKLIKDRNTDKYGEIVYGIVNKVYESGTYINGEAEQKADILVYIESENRFETISEIDGLGVPIYEEDACVKLKYYKGDINFIEEIYDRSLIPLNVQNSIEQYLNNK